MWMLDVATDALVCDKKTGYIQHHEEMLQVYVHDFFTKRGFRLGNYGQDLEAVPSHQPILWSSSRNESRTGLAIQMNHPTDSHWEAQPWAFAIYIKNVSKWPSDMQRELDICKKGVDWYAHYTILGKLQIGCDDVTYYDG
jgi:hypothetical protein